MTNIHIHIDEISIRVYPEGKNYDSRDHYEAIITGVALNDGEIFLCKAHGKIGLKTIIKIKDKLKELGYHTVIMERNGKRKVHQI